MKLDCIVAILTYNSSAIIEETLLQALKVSPKVFLVDSGSTDNTVDIAVQLGCEVVTRKFKNYGDQRNWTIEQLNHRCDWQLHLDADEVLDELAIRSIDEAMKAGKSKTFLLRRRDYFMGKVLKYSGLNPWHLRLFVSGTTRCENRLYDQHFVSSIRAQRLSGYMHDKNAMKLSDWIARHNRWSDLEADEYSASKNEEASDNPNILQGNPFGDTRERTRFLKQIYYKLPGSSRVVLYFVYRYVFRLGFLDGKVGFYFAFFQALWFRMLVDAKIYESTSASEFKRRN